MVIHLICTPRVQDDPVFNPRLGFTKADTLNGYEAKALTELKVEAARFYKNVIEDGQSDWERHWEPWAEGYSLPRLLIGKRGKRWEFLPAKELQELESHHAIGCNEIPDFLR